MIDWNNYDKYLGTCPDSDIAEELDCTPQGVGKRRRLLNIKSYNKTTTKIEWTKYDHLLGTMTDGDLSIIMGCFVRTVFNRRDKLGICRFKKNNIVY